MIFLDKVTEKTEIKTGVAALVLGADDRLLLEKRADCGLWGLLGGKVDVGESLEAAVLREVKEESGLDIEIEKVMGVYSGPKDRIIRYDAGDEKHLIDIVFIARALPGWVKISDESEKLEYFHKEDIPEEAEIIPPAKKPIADFLKGEVNIFS